MEIAISRFYLLIENKIPVFVPEWLLLVQKEMML